MGRISIIILLSVVALPPYSMASDNIEVMRAKEQLLPAGVLPAWETESERFDKIRSPEIIDPLQPEIRRIDDGLLPPPPPPTYRVPAEFEPVSAYVVSQGDWGQNPMLFSLIRHGSKVGGARAIVLTNSSPDSYELTLLNQGIDLSRVALIKPTLGIDSKWTRDYAPITIYETEDDIAGPLGFVDLHYSSRRVKDDAVPEFLSETIGLSRYGLEGNDQTPPDGTKLFMEGGNYQIDGMGTCILSNDIATDNRTNPDANTLEKVEPILAAYLGCEQIIWLTPVPNSGTGHVDMYSKLLTPNDILMIDFPNQSGNNAQADKVQEANVAIMETATNLKGEHFTVHRVTIPSLGSGFFGWVYRTYTNSVMLNNMVLVPTYNAPKYDPLALEVYREILGESYEVIGIPSSSIVAQGGAVHCTTMQIASACGNGTWEPLLEECEGEDLGGQTCEDLGYGPGSLVCDENCEFDTTDCGEKEPQDDTDSETEPDNDSETGSDIDTEIETDPGTDEEGDSEEPQDTETANVPDTSTDTDTAPESKGGIDSDTDVDSDDDKDIDTAGDEGDAGDDVYGNDDGGCGCRQFRNPRRQPLLQLLADLLK